MIITLPITGLELEALCENSSETPGLMEFLLTVHGLSEPRRERKFTSNLQNMSYRCLMTVTTISSKFLTEKLTLNTENIIFVAPWRTIM